MNNNNLRKKGLYYKKYLEEKLFNPLNKDIIKNLNKFEITLSEEKNILNIKSDCLYFEIKNDKINNIKFNYDETITTLESFLYFVKMFDNFIMKYTNNLSLK